ncbi:MAG: UDP-3-O-[3-hydroxymyristoyl] N-acetylglucosamine deacetylase [Firmicutes bacterium ZCTH02-B6]|mgnify:FL=1|nr:MAG: UDP-3-O-[3-hydroxymyristoyl] N-acetylglucosamine deacetylase [Firmicutes bacterium ZCTH02-B6]
MEWQTTLGRPVSLEGIGLHSGKPCRLTLRPAPADTGVRWQRVDLDGQPIVPATVDYVAGTERSTTLALGEARVQTVEHVMAALAGMGVDNALVQVDAPEPPLADGAAAVFADLIRTAGVVQLQAPRRFRRITRPVAVSRGDAHLVALPAERLSISYVFVSDHPALPTQFAEYAMDPETFPKEIAPARTVGWLAEVEALRRRGLALGASLDSAVVVGERELLTPLRFPNEVARHKILDIIGDLALAGRVRAQIIAIRSGHFLHTQFARQLAAEFTEEAHQSP